jgi:hypothetical protein
MGADFSGIKGVAIRYLRHTCVDLLPCTNHRSGGLPIPDLPDRGRAPRSSSTVRARWGTLRRQQSGAQPPRRLRSLAGALGKPAFDGPSPRPETPPPRIPLPPSPPYEPGSHRTVRPAARPGLPLLAAKDLSQYRPRGQSFPGAQLATGSSCSISVQYFWVLRIRVGIANTVQMDNFLTDYGVWKWQCREREPAVIRRRKRSGYGIVDPVWLLARQNRRWDDTE